MNSRYIVQSVILAETKAWWVLDTETNEAVEMPHINEWWAVYRCHNLNSKHKGLRYRVCWFASALNGNALQQIWGVHDTVVGVDLNYRTRNYTEALQKANGLNESKVQS